MAKKGSQKETGGKAGRALQLDAPAKIGEACNFDAKSPENAGACKTPAKAKNTNETKRVSDANSRTSYTHNSTLRASLTRLSDEEFLDLVDRTSTRELRQLFPHEYACHAAMRAREKAGTAVVHDDLHSLKDFLRVLGRAPSPAHTVDRIDTHDPEYAPGKVRWATPTEQARNRVSTITLPYNGQRLPLPQVAELTGKKQDTLRSRLRAGWNEEEAVAGRRFAGDGPAPLSPNSWPAGATVSRWEGPYQGWRKVFRPNEQPAATRAVFFVWIGRNMLDANERVLMEEFPEYFDPENVDPDDDTPLPDAVTSHPSYIGAERLRPMLDEAQALVAADPAQLNFLSALRLRSPITNPKDARPEMLDPRPRQRPRTYNTPPMPTRDEGSGTRVGRLPRPTPASSTPQPPLTLEDYGPGYEHMFKPFPEIDSTDE